MTTNPKALSEELTPGEIVAYLDRYVVGQTKAKRAVAIALRNRMRRRHLPEELAREIAPKNILMVGPTGVGKTEIARRLARLVEAPFVKVEATKFTEVGYVGRDVESLVRDLVESAVQMEKRRRTEEAQEGAMAAAEERLLDALLPSPRPSRRGGVPDFARLLGSLDGAGEEDPSPEEEPRSSATRERLREMLREGRLEGREVDVEVTESPRTGMPLLGNMGMEEMGINLGEMLGNLLPKRVRRTRMKVAEARRVFQAEEAEKLVDMETVLREALSRAQEEGIVFLDEIDKIAAGEGGRGGGPDVSREGVQRDLLPIVEGCVVQTKYGPVHTDHVLFIAAGAFHKVKPSDLVPELQGRLPLRVELDSLGEEDLFRILQEPESSLVGQYQALLGVEGVVLSFDEEALREVASFAARMNAEMENIGARRLQTILELLLEEISFDAHARRGETVVVDASLVRRRLEGVISDGDLRKYLL